MKQLFILISFLSFVLLFWEIYEAVIKNKEAIEVYAQVGTMIAVIVATVALFLNLRAFKLQRDSLQANLFNEVTKRINELLDKEPYQDDKVELRNWYERLFNAFEYFAFYANSCHLTSNMKSYYHSFIGGYCERLKQECPELIEEFKKGPTDKFSELRKYYKGLPF